MDPRIARFNHHKKERIAGRIFLANKWTRRNWGKGHTRREGNGSAVRKSEIRARC
jgi:hypothetical protein